MAVEMAGATDTRMNVLIEGLPAGEPYHDNSNSELFFGL